MTRSLQIVVAVAMAVLTGGLAGPASAADSVTVDAYVTVTGPCLTTSTAVLDFGELAFESIEFSPISYTNCSAARERVFGRGTNATDDGGGETWTLDGSGAPCPDRGLDRFALTTDALLLLATTDRELDQVDAGAPGAVGRIGLFMPCAGSNGIGSIMSFQIVFTATF